MSRLSNYSQLPIRQQQVLKLVCKDKCNSDIAKKLKVSIFTVKWHIRILLQKANVADRKGLKRKWKNAVK